MTDKTKLQSEQSRLKQERADGKRALNELLKPISGRLLLARILAAASGIIFVAPYVALMALGETFLSAATQHQPVDAARAWFIAQILISAFMARLGLYFVALLVTNFADLKFGFLVRKQMVGWRTPACVDCESAAQKKHRLCYSTKPLERSTQKTKRTS